MGCFQTSAQKGFAWRREEGRQMTKKFSCLKIRNICWSHEPWSSLGQGVLPSSAWPSLISGPVFQHIFQQSQESTWGTNTELCALQAQLLERCRQPQWGSGCCNHAMVTPTHRCLGDLGTGCENESQSLLGLPGFLCGRQSFQFSDG